MKIGKARFLSVFLALLTALTLLSGCGDSHENEAKTPLSSKDCRSMHYQDVVDEFKSAGFSNIKTEADPDLVFGWFNSDGEISSISINGETKFDANVWLPDNSDILIVYHTYPTTEEETSEETTQDSPDSTESTPSPELETTPAKTDSTEEAIPENSTFSIHFIDVGQADAALVECDGEYMLIDGGNKSDSNVIFSVLKSAGVQHLKLVVGTHAHEDHIGGLPGAFNYTTADMTLCATTSYDSDAFADFTKYADLKGNGVTVPSVGDVYELGSSDITILGVNGGSDTNDTSIVLKIQYGDTAFLFTGDAEREAEQAILNSGADLSSTVLKVGHHGSDTSTTYPFLREIMPAYAVISVGEGNSYGHPTDDTLSRLRDADVKVYRTDMQGDIYCTSDGKTVTFTVDRNADVDTLTSAGGVQSSTDVTHVVPVVPSEPEPELEPEPAPVGTEYIGNKNTKKFHETWCSSVDKMKESNKYYYTGTREGIINKGYVPCKNCDP